jgi:hypothetical protein
VGAVKATIGLVLSETWNLRGRGGDSKQKRDGIGVKFTRIMLTAWRSEEGGRAFSQQQSVRAHEARAQAWSKGHGRKRWDPCVFCGLSHQDLLMDGRRGPRGLLSSWEDGAKVSSA